MKIAIVGGGIGGLTLALALADAGLEDIVVYESAPTIKELGVGINILPHATRELAELGLLDDMYEVAIPTQELVYYSKRGQRIWGEPRGLAAGYKWPQFSIHRGELQTLLFRAVVRRLGASRVLTGHHLGGFSQTGETVSMEFLDRKDGVKVATAEADLMIACDGVHSTVRRAFYPNEGPPKWNGVTMWRATTEAKPFLTGRSMIMAGTFARRVVVYPISKKHDDRGMSLINWVAELKIADDQPMPVQDWEFIADRDEVLKAFGGFEFDFLNVPEMIRNSSTIYQYPMVDRDALDTWVHGRVVLLGDAAHPMYPVGSNGASQAIIDARVLARELALKPSVEEALSAYDGVRRPATAAVVAANRKVGPELCMEIVEERAPDGFTRIEEIIPISELEEISARYKRTAGFDPNVLNGRESLSVKRG